VVHSAEHTDDEEEEPRHHGAHDDAGDGRAGELVLLGGRRRDRLGAARAGRGRRGEEPAAAWRERVAAELEVAGERVLREPRQRPRDGPVQVVVGDVEHGEHRDADAGDAPRQAVPVEPQHPQRGEAVERERDAPRQVVVREDEALEPGEPRDPGGDGAGQLVPLQEEGLEVGQLEEVVGEGPEQAVGAEREHAQVGEPAERARRDGADEADAREADVHNRGLGRVAGDPDPAARGSVGAPPEPALVRGRRQERQQRGPFARRRLRDGGEGERGEYGGQEDGRAGAGHCDGRGGSVAAVGRGYGRGIGDWEEGEVEELDGAETEELWLPPRWWCCRLLVRAAVAFRSLGTECARDCVRVSAQAAVAAVWWDRDSVGAPVTASCARCTAPGEGAAAAACISIGLAGSFRGLFRERAWASAAAVLL
jgi:hypothetical protein